MSPPPPSFIYLFIYLYLNSGLYWRIWHMDLIQSAVLYSVMTLVSTYLVAFAYKNVKFVLKHKVAQKREDAVSKEVTRKLSEADNRKMSRKEKDERFDSTCKMCYSQSGHLAEGLLGGCGNWNCSELHTGIAEDVVKGRLIIGIEVSLLLVTFH